MMFPRNITRVPPSNGLLGSDPQLCFGLALRPGGYDYTDRQLEVRWKGISLPYRAFAKDQRVTQTAIVENKRLGHALSLVKVQQELKRETKVLTNSQKGGYKKRPRLVYGPNFIEKPLAPKTVEMTV